MLLLRDNKLEVAAMNNLEVKKPFAKSSQRPRIKFKRCAKISFRQSSNHRGDFDSLALLLEAIYEST